MFLPICVFHFPPLRYLYFWRAKITCIYVGEIDNDEEKYCLETWVVFILSSFS